MSQGMCHRCGDCCDGAAYRFHPYELNVQLAVLEAHYDADHEDVRSLRFMTEHWTLRDRDGGWSYDCDRFDAGARVCTAHEDRPPVCSGYPWYGSQPAPGKTLSPRCGFLYDLDPEDRPEDSPLLPVV